MGECAVHPRERTGGVTIAARVTVATMAAANAKREVVEVVRAELVQDLDLARYDVRRVAADVMGLAALPVDAMRAVFYTAIAGVIGFALTALLFVTRMSLFWLFLFAAIGGFLVLFCGVVVAVSLVAHRKLRETIGVADEVLDVVAQMHRDLVELRNGKAQLTVRATAATLSADVVFPMMSEAAIAAAETYLRGPLKPLARPLIGRPLQVAEKAVTASIANLPVAALDAAVSGDATDDAASVDDMVEAMREIDDRYEAAKKTVAGHVRSFMTKSQVPAVIFAALALMPLVCWWLLGFLVT